MNEPVHARPAAWIILPGHPDSPAHLSATRYSSWGRVSRTLMWGVTWIVSTVATFLITIFDPFFTAMPFLVGAVMTYRTWRGRFRVTDFAGACPRCREPLTLKDGSKIGSPHPMVCYNCHHEPELYLATA